MDFKYFTIDSDSTIDSLKKQFKKNCRELHPDFFGGCKKKEEEFKAMMIEYEEALKQIGKIKGKKYKFDPEYADIILALLKLEMVDVDIEICGWFVYVTGETKPYREKLGKEGLGLIWNPKKTCWYWKPAWYRKRGKESWSMDRIRQTWGSEKVEQKKKEKEERKKIA